MAKKQDTTQYKTYSEITDADFKNMEQKHGKLVIIDVPIQDEDDEDFDPDNVAKFVLKRNPKPGVIKAVKRYASQEVPNLEKIESLSKNEVLLGGDLKYIEEESADYTHSIYMAVDSEIGKIFKGKTAKVGKR